MAFVSFLAIGPLCLIQGGLSRVIWTSACALYVPALAAIGAATIFLHRRPRVALLAMLGAVAGHATAGVRLLAGLVTRGRSVGGAQT